MEFQTPTVQSKKNPKARISAVGAVLLVVAAFMAMVDGYEKYALWTFGASILIFLFGAFYAKGDLADFEISNAIPLVVSGEGIRIGSDFYQMGQVKNIDFDIEGFAGMGEMNIAMPGGAESDGTKNRLKFGYLDQSVECIFYLGGPQQVQQLGALFRSFYDRRIPFVEHRGLYQTYMLKPVSKKELESIKLGLGYV